jgi:hypothetical protein
MDVGRRPRKRNKDKYMKLATWNDEEVKEDPDSGG